MSLKLFSFSCASRVWLARQSDATLIAECLAGNEHAWDAIVERFAPLINTVTIRMGLSTDDGADVLQEVCLKLLHHLSDLRDRSLLSAWIVVTTRHEVYRLRQK